MLEEIRSIWDTHAAAITITVIGGLAVALLFFFIDRCVRESHLNGQRKDEIKRIKHMLMERESASATPLLFPGNVEDSVIRKDLHFCMYELYKNLITDLHTEFTSNTPYLKPGYRSKALEILRSARATLDTHRDDQLNPMREIRETFDRFVALGWLGYKRRHRLIDDSYVVSIYEHKIGMQSATSSGCFIVSLYQNASIKPATPSAEVNTDIMKHINDTLFIRDKDDEEILVLRETND